VQLLGDGDEIAQLAKFQVKLSGSFFESIAPKLILDKIRGGRYGARERPCRSSFAVPTAALEK
jgi:hypothetical protein